MLAQISSLNVYLFDETMPATPPAAEVWTGTGGQGLATAAICRAIRVTEGRRGERVIHELSAGLQTASVQER